MPLTDRVHDSGRTVERQEQAEPSSPPVYECVHPVLVVLLLEDLLRLPQAWVEDQEVMASLSDAVRTELAAGLLANNRYLHK